MKKFLYPIFFLMIFVSCQEKQKSLDAQQIIDRAIKKAGGKAYENSIISFVFRGKEYRSSRNAGKFSLQREIVDSTGSFKDVLTNEGFARYRGDSVIALPDSSAATIKNSVNSVHYFVQLPFGLNQSAVKKELLGEDSIKGKVYYEVKVNFKKENGGKDYEDSYLYWINKKTFTVDYLAYTYDVNGGGMRFRAAYNPRKVNGLRFVDYKNYKPANQSVKLQQLDSLFTANKLILYSTIKTEHVKVSRFN